MFRRATCGSIRSAPAHSKFGAFKPNEYIKVTRSSDYWKEGRPYLDGIEYTIIKNLSTANLAFIAGTFDMTFPYALSVPLLKDVTSRVATGNLRVDPYRRQPQLDS
jgi:peptide/nickel transport system substrate-binding protein